MPASLFHDSVVGHSTAPDPRAQGRSSTAFSDATPAGKRSRTDAFPRAPQIRRKDAIDARPCMSRQRHRIQSVARQSRRTNVTARKSSLTVFIFLTRPQTSTENGASSCPTRLRKPNTSVPLRRSQRRRDKSREAPWVIGSAGC